MKLSAILFLAGLALVCRLSLDRSGIMSAEGTGCNDLGVACDALCFFYFPRVLNYTFRKGCLDADDVCWCCNPPENYNYSYNTTETVDLCPDAPNCENYCYTYDYLESSHCPSSCPPGGGPDNYPYPYPYYPYAGYPYSGYPYNYPPPGN